MNDNTSNISQKEQQFKQSLKRLVSRLDKNFGSFMKNIKCNGTVELINPDNFSTIGLNIKVSFRDEMEVQSLNSQVQSGGVDVGIANEP